MPMIVRRTIHSQRLQDGRKTVKSVEKATWLTRDNLAPNQVKYQTQSQEELYHVTSRVPKVAQPMHKYSSHNE